MKLGERELLVRDRAEHQRGHADIELPVLHGKASGVAVDDGHRHRRAGAARWARPRRCGSGSTATTSVTVGG